MPPLPFRKTSALPAPQMGDSVAAPLHVAIIMDGNGRWARQRGLPRSTGHKKGADALRRVMDACRERGVRYLTVYAFSSENWQRPPAEIKEIMQLLRNYLDSELPALCQNGVKLHVIGDVGLLESDIRQRVEEAMSQTAMNNAFQLTVALSYGSRQEITRAFQQLASRVAQGQLSPEQIDSGCIEQALDTADIPEPDLLIRTGGEQRLSNFLLWQCAYTELYFTPILWPDFTAGHFTEALQEFARRDRRYGTADG